MSKNIGKVSKVIGAVVDVEFSAKGSSLPEIYDSLEITREDGSTKCNLPSFINEVDKSVKRKKRFINPAS